MIGLIEKLLDATERHSQAVILALLGILIAGAVGGGLWINSLKSTLADREALEKQRLALIEDKFNSRAAQADLKVREMFMATRDMRVAVKDHQKQVQVTVEQLTAIAKSPQLPSSFSQQLQSVAERLERKDAELSRAEGQLEDARSGGGSGLGAGSYETSKPHIDFVPEPSSFLVVIAFSIIAVAVVRRHRRKTATLMLMALREASKAADPVGLPPGIQPEILRTAVQNQWREGREPSSPKVLAWRLGIEPRHLNQWWRERKASGV